MIEMACEMADALSDAWESTADVVDSIVDRLITDWLSFFLAAAVERGTLEECVARGRQADGLVVWDEAWRLPKADA
jgi:hypothetical protein